MATLVSVQTGNWTSAATWGVVSNTGGGTSNNTSTTTAYVYNPAFTVTNATVLVGLLMICRRNNTTGTVSVTLSDDNGVTATREVTVNASDLEPSTNGDWAWVFFKFASTLTADGGSDYRVGIKGSSSGNANFLRSGTASDWQYFLVSNATQTPVASDVTFTVGARTAAATITNVTVTMNETATTEYSTVVVADGGTLSWDTTQSTVLRTGASGGGFQVDYNGVASLGTSGTPIPRAVNAILEFACASDGQYGLRVKPGGTVNAYGESRTSGKDVMACRLTSDLSATDTLLQVDTDTGWKSGDEIGIAATFQTPSQFELATLATDATASTITLSTGVTNEHLGVSPLQAEVVLLTRNVKIRSTSATNMSWIRVEDVGTFNGQWFETRYCGNTTVGAQNCALRLQTTTTCTFRYIAIRDAEAFGIATTAAMSGFSLRDSVIYNCFRVGTHGAVYIETTTVANYTIQNLYVMGGGSGSSTQAIRLRNLGSGCTLQGIYASSLNTGPSGIVFYTEGGGSSVTVDGFNFHSNTSGGGELGAFGSVRTDWTFKNGKVWHNADLCFNVHAFVYANYFLDNVVFYGNADAGVYAEDEPSMVGWRFRDCRFAGTIYHDQPRGFWLNVSTGSVLNEVSFESCWFGVEEDLFVAHTTADFDFASGGLHYVTLRMVYCRFGEGTFLNGFTIANGVQRGSYVSSQHHNQLIDAKVYTPLGTLAHETEIALKSPALKMTPTTASWKLASHGDVRGKGFLVPINNGATRTVQVRVRKDSSYNGAAPRLIVKSNPAVGITSDTVLDTFASGADVWEGLSGTTGTATANGVIECVVDCDGTAGNIYVDSWNA